jgi:hypothetical protein
MTPEIAEERTNRRRNALRQRMVRETEQYLNRHLPRKGLSRPPREAECTRTDARPETAMLPSGETYSQAVSASPLAGVRPAKAANPIG